MKLKLFIMILAVLTVGASAQSIKPGDARIKINRLHPSHDFYRNVITDTVGNIKYDFMMENFCRIDTARQQVIFARSRQVPPGSFSTDTSVTDLSFKPIRMHEIHQTQNVIFDMQFGPEKATVKTTRKGVETVRSYAMEKGYFEDNMIEYLFGCLDLQKGQTYKLDNFNPATSGNDPYTVKYEFDDIWNPAADVRINCTVLYFTHGAVSGYIWIDKNTHAILKELGHGPTYNFVLTKQ